MSSSASRRKIRRHPGLEGLVAQFRPVERRQLPQPRQIERTRHAAHILGPHLEVLHQNFEDVIGDRGVRLQPHRAPETPPPHRLFHRFQKVVALEFLDRHFRVPGHMERMRFHNLEAGKQRFQIGRDHLLDPDELRHGRGSLAAPGRRTRNHNQLRQRFGNFHARKMPLAQVIRPARVVQHDREIQAQIRDMRERPSRVERQRRQHGENGFGVVTVHGLALPVIERGVVRNHDPVLRQFRQELILETVVDLRHQLIHAGMYRFQLLRRRLPVDAEVGPARRQLLFQRRHPHHEKLVQIGAHDGNELHPLQQLVVRVSRLFEHTPLKLQQAQFAVHVKRRFPQYGQRLRRFGGWRVFRGRRSTPGRFFSFCHSAKTFSVAVRTAGRIMVNVEPLPSRLSTLIVPSIRSTTCLTIESPRPVPPTSRERARSTR